MAVKKSLQKLTKAETEINELLALKKITVDDLKLISLKGLNSFNAFVTTKMNTLTGVERDRFYNKIELIVAPDTKNQLWEGNHNSITYAISTLIQELGRMPSKTEIANKSELSRQTIYKHMADYANNPQYLKQIEQFKFMTSKVLAKVFTFAVNGDMGAAKLYFNVLGCLGGQPNNNTSIQNQNNYIQINGTVLSQETIKLLNPEQLNSIETILKTALPQAIKLEAK